MTRTGHHQRRPHITAQPVASAARKNIMPNQGFQYGLTATPGIHATTPTMVPLATSPPKPPSTDRVASIATEAAAMHHSAAPQSTPRPGSRWTGTASSQY